MRNLCSWRTITRKKTVEKLSSTSSATAVNHNNSIKKIVFKSFVIDTCSQLENLSPVCYYQVLTSILRYSKDRDKCLSRNKSSAQLIKQET